VLLTLVQLIYSAIHVYNFTRFLTRLSILLFYVRIFRLQGNKLALIPPIVCGTLLFFVYIVILFLDCQPLSYFWTQWDREHQGHCLNSHDLFWALNSIGVAYDLWCILLPLLFVRRLKLSFKKKVMSSAMFTVGLR